MKKAIRILSVILTIFMLAQIMPVSAEPIPTAGAQFSAREFEAAQALTPEQAAAAATETPAVEKNRIDEPVAILAEDESLREENAKHFRNENGSYTVAMYPEPVHFKVPDGAWQDIDNTLSLDNSKMSAANKATYTPAASGLDIRIPQEFADGQMITIGKDGYTVGLGVSAKNKGVQLEKPASVANADRLASIADDATAIAEADDLFVGPLTKKQQVEEVNAKRTELKKLTSAVTYVGVFPGADLEYHLTPSRLKESLVIKEAQKEYTYLFDLSLGGLIPVPQKDGSIGLYANTDGEPLFILEAPYMYDAAGEESKDLSMKLAADGTLNLTANAEWVNAKGREFPVTIDPTIANAVASSFADAYISTAIKTANYSSGAYNYAGNGLLGTRRTYIQFDLPTLSEGSVVVSAQLQVRQDSCDYYHSTQLYAFDLTGMATWSAKSITWNFQPLSGVVNGPRDNGTPIIDYDAVNTSGSKNYYFDITRQVKNWYEAGGNKGIMLTTQDESSDCQPCLYSVRSSTSSNRPALSVTYMSNVGLESYWSYETLDMGRSGTAYINDFNGALTYTHSDLSMTGQMVPINISHVFSTNVENRSSLPSNMKMGTGFSLNLNERIVAIPSGSDLYSNGYHYKWIDSDGTVHYFKYSSTSSSFTFYNMDGSSTIKLLKSPMDIEVYSEQSDDFKQFDLSTGYLCNIGNKNGKQEIYWSGGRIIKVIDASNRTATFSYNSSNYLTSIQDPAGRLTNFSYNSSGQLTGITYPDGKSTGFQYDSSGILSRVNAYNGSATAFVTSSSKVTSATSYAKNGSTIVDKLTFTYSQGKTKVTNNYQKFNEYIFDSAGHAVNVINQDAQSSFALYCNDGSNRLSMTSTTQTVVTNLINDSSYERGAAWTVISSGSPTGSISRSTAQAFRGSYSLAVANTSGTGYYGARYPQDIAVTAGQTYTLSAYVLVPTALTGSGTVNLAYSYTNSAGTLQWTIDSALPANNTWGRYSYTFTIPSGITAIRPVVIVANGSGTAYFDAVQLEGSEGANTYNLVDNSNFADSSGTTATYWTMSNTQSGDGVITESGRKLVKMTGAPGNDKKITQRIQLGAKAGDTIIFGGKARATAIGSDGDVRQFSVNADFYTAAGAKIGTTKGAPFYRFVYDLDQMTAAAFTTPSNAAYMDLTFVYYKQLGVVRFYDAFVYVGDFITEYGYANGLLKKITSDNGREVTIQYNVNKDITSISRKQNGQSPLTTTISYDSQRRISNVTDNGITTAYTYLNSTTTIVTSVTTSSGSLTTSESMTYTSDSNYVATHTDARGGVSSYTYNLAKGLLTSATDPKGNTVSYAYDANNDALLSTTGNASSSAPVTTGFSYLSQDYILSSISHNGMSYSYAYDNLNRVTTAKVGTQTLVTNTYDSRQRLSKQTFANGAVYEPVYDSRDRLAGEKWGGAQTAAYNYNSNNQLTQIADKTNNITYQYNYDLSNRIESVTGSDSTNTRIKYDAKNMPNRLTFAQNGATIFDAGYTTNDQGMVTGSTLYSLSSATLSYTCDGLNRPTTRTLAIPSAASLKTSLTYLTGTNSKATGLVSQYKNEKVGTGTLQQYDYTYDANGNILTIKEGGTQKASYVYDGLNRLTRENNAWANKSYAYNYDAGGNLTSVTTHAYTTGTLGSATATQSYTYGNSNWKDQLTNFAGKAITYDTQGNPLTYDGRTYTWQKGRQLASISGVATYTYDAFGRRTKKVVGSTTTTYTYAGNLLMRQQTGSNIMDFSYDAGGNAVGFKYNSTPYFYLRNLQGDVVGIADTSGTVIASYTYDAWGNILSATGSNMTIANANPIRYRGYYWDAETGYYFLQTRYYSPEWRRFINADCMFIAGDILTGSNMYTYCNGNPVMYWDPWGMALTSWEALGYALTIGSYIVLLPEILWDPLTNAVGVIINAMDQTNTAEVIGTLNTVIGNLGRLYDFISGWTSDPKLDQDQIGIFIATGTRLFHWIGDTYSTLEDAQKFLNSTFIAGKVVDLSILAASFAGLDLSPFVDAAVIAFDVIFDLTYLNNLSETVSSFGTVFDTFAAQFRKAFNVTLPITNWVSFLLGKTGGGGGGKF